jgi:CBS domain-containing protein
MTSIGEICKRNVVVAPKDMTVVQAAEMMRRDHIGDLVVVDHRNHKRVPVGVASWKAEGARSPVRGTQRRAGGSVKEFFHANDSGNSGTRSRFQRRLV